MSNISSSARVPTPITSASAPLDLLHLASLTNSELFRTVLSKIQRNVPKEQKDWINRTAAGQHAVVDVVQKAAMGAAGCQCQEDWVREVDQLYRKHADPSSHQHQGCELQPIIGEATRKLPADYHKLRLAAALKNTGTMLTVRQAAGLVRGAAYVGDSELQAQAIECLVRVFPILQTDPNHICSVIQTPTLRKVPMSELERGGLTLSSSSSKQTFQSLVEFGRNEEEGQNEIASNEGMDTKRCNNNGGCKRKRSWENFLQMSNVPSLKTDSGDADTNFRSILMHRLVQAAHLARRGTQRGAKHGAVLCVPLNIGDTCIDDDISSIVSYGDLQRDIGMGWNHNIVLDPRKKGKNKLVSHSEVHAVADAIRTYGETMCFDVLFPRATIVIVELVDDYTYDVAHPCPKCHTFLRAVGIIKALHSTSEGGVDETDLSPANPELLARDVARIPFRAALEELGITCERLENIETTLA